MSRDKVYSCVSEKIMKFWSFKRIRNSYFLILLIFHIKYGQSFASMEHFTSSISLQEYLKSKEVSLNSWNMP
jgi:hypothetical protein